MLSTYPDKEAPRLKDAGSLFPLSAATSIKSHSLRWHTNLFIQLSEEEAMTTSYSQEISVFICQDLPKQNFSENK
jgi:hypothetical protein